MDLKKLFSVQKVLRDRINYNESDRFDKLILALLVEVGECAQEWRGFKFWSKDQEPRTKTECEECGGDKVKGWYDDVDCGCEDVKNPLLEEYVDIAHFILELGIEIGIETTELVVFDREHYMKKTTHGQFMDIFKRVIDIQECGGEESRHYYWMGLFISFVVLGEMLGFNWEEVEDAYMKKNEINHKRQDSGTY